jgi:hypothetical protein
MMMKPRVAKTRPQANFAGLEGSRDPSRIQSQAKNGPNMKMMKNEFTDWNQLDGKSKPSRLVRVLRSANSVRVEPACSNAAQNRVANTKKSTMAPIRLRSTEVQPGRVSR